MLKGQIALTATRPTQPVVGGGGDTVPPTVPPNLHVTAHTSASIALAWTASTDNVGVTGYRIQQNGAVIGSVSGTQTTYTAVGPEPVDRVHVHGHRVRRGRQRLGRLELRSRRSPTRRPAAAPRTSP